MITFIDQNVPPVELRVQLGKLAPARSKTR